MEGIISHWSRWTLGRRIIVDVLEFLVDPLKSHGDRSDVVLCSWDISSYVWTQSWLWNEASQSDDSKYKCSGLDLESHSHKWLSQTQAMISVYSPKPLSQLRTLPLLGAENTQDSETRADPGGAARSVAAGCQHVRPCSRSSLVSCPITRLLIGWQLLPSSPSLSQ